MATYAIRGGVEGKRRLDLLAEMMAPTTKALLADAGLEEIHVRIVHPVHTGRAPARAMSLSTLENIADAVVAEGLATAADLADTIRELASFTDDPHSLIACPRVFQVWGRRTSCPPA